MAMRDAVRAVAAPIGRGLDAANARHPWSHNDAFHSWILARLPARRGLALDIGCGRGNLVATLAEHFEEVRGVDVDAPMREAARRRCVGLSNVIIDDTDLTALPEGADLVTMVAVLHHLDIDRALAAVSRTLRSGGRFLCVGLSRPVSVVDHAFDIASAVTNPLIGLVRHPRVALAGKGPAPCPTIEPQLSLDHIRDATRRHLPGAEVRRHLAFRHTIDWTRPRDRSAR
ncbi:class I SAM-dependent methyltransferase [Mobilicoccus sp.]|uniref:class I SAM-dependent methyltransferase n=1 Tax=Mobilicoccus sp. TaxID=2034349 RepID=UPI00289D7222|nr:class I SAM-dependent methyltransferase [Mobilicoccus sp.]